MEKLPVYNLQAEKVKETELNPAMFGVAVKESVVHQVMVAQMANARVAIAHTKTKGEVRGGGRKPWKQKGTGRARHGSIRSPLWKGGGVTFGPRSNRNFSQKVNKKMKTKALFMCLSDKVNNGLMFLVDKLSLAEGKTKEFVGVVKNFKNILILKEIKKSKKTETGNQKSETSDQKLETGNKFDIKRYKLSILVVLPKSDKNTFRAGRNLAGVKITTADSLNVVDLLKYKNIIISEEALPVIEKTYLKN
ncbi:MAG: 50S ribosomal protein L4 [Patescibacteria group bacterium]|nr:50S ribosomal protein L4 [Patescibacteria group bacterium]